MKVPLGVITRSGLLDPFHWIPELGGHMANSLCLVPLSHHASLHGIIMDISFLHLSFIIFMHCICMSHCIIIHLHLAWFCSANYIHSIFTIRMLCSLVHYPCIFLCEIKNKKRTKRKSQWSMKVYTAFLVTCVGYHDDSYKQTMLGLYFHFSW